MRNGSNNDGPEFQPFTTSVQRFSLLSQTLHLLHIQDDSEDVGEHKKDDNDEQDHGLLDDIFFSFSESFSNTTIGAIVVFVDVVWS